LIALATVADFGDADHRGQRARIAGLCRWFLESAVDPSPFKVRRDTRRSRMMKARG